MTRTRTWAIRLGLGAALALCVGAFESQHPAPTEASTSGAQQRIEKEKHDGGHQHDVH